MLGLVAGILLARKESDTLLTQARADVLARLAAIRARLEGVMASTFNLTQGIVHLVSIRGDIEFDLFDDMTRQAIALNRHIRNVALAPGNVVRWVSPMAGNERVIGLDYMAHQEQRDGVLRAMQLGRPVLAGPINLVQGGRGLINRAPIFLESPPDRPKPQRYWGMASIVAHLDGILAECGVSTAEDMRLALRGRDAMGTQGGIIWGDGSLFTRDTVQMPVIVPGGSWLLAAEPAAGWPSGSMLASSYLWIGLLNSLLLATLVGFLAERTMRIHDMAMHDALTGLPNLRRLRERLRMALARGHRSGRPFAVLQLDLDRFKPINDLYGHDVGDKVLVAVSRRMQDVLRQADLLSRVGGDEFVVVAEDLPANHRPTLDHLAERLNAAATQPVLVRGRLYEVGLSIGVAVFPFDGEDAVTLVRRADAAMYAAKRHGECGRPCHYCDLDDKGSVDSGARDD